MKKIDRSKLTDDFIAKLINTKPDIEEGKKMIFDAVKQIIPAYNIASLKGLDFDRTLIEFENWLVQTITTDPIPISVKSLWFGLADTTNKEDAATGVGGEIQMTIKGTKYLPQTRPKDWFKKDLWDASSKTSEIKAYKTISNSLKNYADDAQDIQSLVLVSLTVLLIINGFDIIKHEFLIYQNSLVIGCGYETGNQYIVGKLVEDGMVNC
ncbi:hypothetical protein MASR1M45_27100 [Candidatus Kapaibacterium sp.]